MSEAYKSYYNDETKVLHLDFLTKLTSEQWRESHYEMLELAKEKRPYLYLVSADKMDVVAIKEQDFVRNDIFPKMIEYSPENKQVLLAVMMGSGAMAAFARFAAQRILKKPPEGLTQKMCKNREEATQWLKENI